jgi:hypothetical protein
MLIFPNKSRLPNAGAAQENQFVSHLVVLTEKLVMQLDILRILSKF